MRTTDIAPTPAGAASKRVAAASRPPLRGAWPLPVCLALLLLAGCGGGGGSSSSAGLPVGPVKIPAPAGVPSSASAVTPSGLTATLTEEDSTVAVGTSVGYVLTLTNSTGQPITFTPITSLSFPAASTTAAVGGFLSITSSTGTIAYPPPVNGGTHGGSMFGPPVTLAPGQSATGSVTTGNVFSAAGTYSATALFTSRPGDTDPTQTTSVGPLTLTVQ